MKQNSREAVIFSAFLMSFSCYRTTPTTNIDREERSEMARKEVELVAQDPEMETITTRPEVIIII